MIKGCFSKKLAESVCESIFDSALCFSHILLFLGCSDPLVATYFIRETPKLSWFTYKMSIRGHEFSVFNLI